MSWMKMEDVKHCDLDEIEFVERENSRRYLWFFFRPRRVIPLSSLFWVPPRLSYFSKRFFLIFYSKTLFFPFVIVRFRFVKTFTANHFLMFPERMGRKLFVCFFFTWQAVRDARVFNKKNMHIFCWSVNWKTT